MRSARILSGLVVLLALAGTVRGAPPAQATSGGAAVEELSQKYLNGEFEPCVALIKEKSRELGSLNAAQAADLAIIKQGLTECYPTWLKQVKAKKKTVFKPAVFTHTLNATFDPDINSNINMNITNGQAFLTLNFGVADLESTEKFEHGFTKGDAANANMWLVIGGGDAWGAVATSPGATAEEMSKLPFSRFVEFRGDLTALYYCTPRARRWIGFLGMAGFEDKYKGENTVGARRAVGAFIMTELLTNPKKYPSFKLPASVSAETPEGDLAEHLKKIFEKGSLTLAEDKSLRDAAKAFATVNYLEAYKSTGVLLPNKLQMAFDVEVDKQLAAKRHAWIKTQLEKNSPPEKPAPEKPAK